MLLSRAVWQMGGEDEKERVRVSPYDTDKEVEKRELSRLVRQAIAMLPSREQKLAEDILDALNYIQEDDIQEYSLWKEIAKKLTVSETEVVKVFSSLARILEQNKQAGSPLVGRGVGCCVRTGARIEERFGWGNFMEALGFDTGNVYLAADESYAKIFGQKGWCYFLIFG